MVFCSCQFAFNGSSTTAIFPLKIFGREKNDKILDCFTSSEVMISSFPKPKCTFAPVGSL